jgi:hypothetical protein
MTAAPARDTHTEDNLMMRLPAIQHCIQRQLLHLPSTKCV